MPAPDRPPILLHTPGSPRWLAPSPDAPLLYLGWGERDFHRTPLPMHRKAGWSYTLVRSGTVRMTLPSATPRLKAGTLLIAAPECPYGLAHEPGERCDLFVWLWNAPPTLDALHPHPAAYAHHHLSGETRQQLEHLHAECRREITHPDAFTPGVFSAVRTRVDTALARSLTPAPPGGNNAARVALAEQWMHANLAARKPTALLADYLQISPSSLHKLFRTHRGRSPGAVHQQHKLREARRLIHEEGWLVKQAAYHLGYRHPNDLSRALHRAAPHGKK